MAQAKRTPRIISRWFARALLFLLAAHTTNAQNANSRAYSAAQEQSRVFAQQSFSAGNAAAFQRNIVAPTIVRVEQYTWNRAPSYSRSYTPNTNREPVSAARTDNSGRFAGAKSGLQISNEILASVGELDNPYSPNENTEAGRARTPSHLTKDQLQVIEAWKYFMGEGRSRDAQKAVALSRPAAQSGDADAALLLGVAYLKGDAVEQDNKRAFEWMSRAAAKDNRVAQALLGEFYFAGVGAEPDEGKAMALFAKSADAGQAYAQLRVSQVLMQGGGGDRDFAKALNYATRAERTLPRAGFEVGFILLTGRPGVTADPQRAVAALERSAKSGYALSQYLYATCLQAGLGVSKDLTAAVLWLRKAADQGLAMARMRMGEVYAYGLGTASDRAVALQWFEMAAKDGEPGALNAIGILYSEDVSTSANVERAVDYFKKAAEQGDSAAQLNLGTLYLIGKGVPPDESQALRLLTEAADRGQALAQYLVGLLYLGGGNFALNESEAVRRIKQAAQQSNPEAMNMLCELSMLGRGGLRMDNAELTQPMEDGIKEQQSACIYVAAIRLERGLLGPQDSNKGLELLKQSANLGYHFAELDLGQLYLLGRYVPMNAAQGKLWVQRAAEHGNVKAQQLLQQAGLR